MGGKLVNPNCTPQPYRTQGYDSFGQFYPFYLGEHSHISNRRLHLVGTGISVLLFTFGVFVGPMLKFLIIALAQGYSFAWVGHFFFEKNKPATFKHPFYSTALGSGYWTTAVLIFSILY